MSNTTLGQTVTVPQIGRCIAAAMLVAGIAATAILIDHRLRPAPPAAPLTGPASLSYELTVRQQAIRSRQLQGAVLVFGDSITVALATSAVAPDVENFGINSDTIAGLASRLPSYRLGAQRAVVLAIGANDIGAGRSIRPGYVRLVARVPAGIAVVAVSVTPQRGKARQIRDANRTIASVCAARPGCTYLDLARHLAGLDGLAPQYDAGDGVHLSPAALRLWANLLRRTL